jgi:hypothetical protein
MKSFFDSFDVPKFIATTVALAFIALVFVIVLIKPTIAEAGWAFVGILGTAFTTLVQFYWGSSAGSKTKESALLPPPDHKAP